MKREMDISIISDVHLGTYGCHAKELLSYLKSLKTKILILNGDFIDMWQFKKSYFPKEHLLIIQRILKMAAQGTKVYYITGNHDDGLRRYSDFSSGNIHLRDKLLLNLEGKSYWVFHGDIFDTLTTYSPLLAKMGGKGYDYLIRINRAINQIRTYLGMSRMSFAGKVKNSVKEAIKFIGDFEKTAIRLASEQDYDFVICGHIHRPQFKTEVYNGKTITYMNSGDWVENLTALEYRFGQWAIYEYDENDFEFNNPKLSVPDVIDEEDNIDEILKPEFFLGQMLNGMGKNSSLTY